MYLDDLQAHDGETLRVGLWVAVAYDKEFYVGEITDKSNDGINVNFLAEKKDGYYKWPRPKDTALVNPEYIFCSKHFA